jgi:hypothetical protein
MKDKKPSIHFIKAANLIINEFKDPTSFIDYIADLIYPCTALTLKYPNSDVENRNVIWELQLFQKAFVKPWLISTHNLAKNMAIEMNEFLQLQSAETWYHTMCRALAMSSMDMEIFGMDQVHLRGKLSRISTLFDVVFLIDKAQEENNLLKTQTKL